MFVHIKHTFMVAVGLIFVQSPGYANELCHQVLEKGNMDSEVRLSAGESILGTSADGSRVILIGSHNVRQPNAFEVLLGAGPVDTVTIRILDLPSDLPNAGITLPFRPASLNFGSPFDKNTNYGSKDGILELRNSKNYFSASLGPDGRFLAVPGLYGNVNLISVDFMKSDKGQLTPTDMKRIVLEGVELQNFKLSGHDKADWLHWLDSSRILIKSQDFDGMNVKLEILDTSTGKIDRSFVVSLENYFKTRPLRKPESNVSLSPDGQSLSIQVTQGGPRLLVDMASGKVVREL